MLSGLRFSTERHIQGEGEMGWGKLNPQQNQKGIPKIVTSENCYNNEMHASTGHRDSLCFISLLPNDWKFRAVFIPVSGFFPKSPVAFHSHMHQFFFCISPPPPQLLA